ncbi:MAG TPA: 4'-phosphopantetheinyl transferase superfamily protein [Polyangiaceae bacterium]|nr:4'-phosphopantetheinyl transferase superfamily protein [Polyangiaceae bacterium]
MPDHLDVAFDLTLAHGRCVGVRLPEDDARLEALAQVALAHDERAFAERLGRLRRRTWVGGRAALREALVRSGLAAPPCLADERGAPTLPAGIGGSISHKDDLAVALVAQGEAAVGVDVEVEVDAPHRIDIAPRVLTSSEAEELAGLDPAARAAQVLLRFSLKEAVYKALDRFVRRYVAFTEVAARPRADGGADVTLFLAPGSTAGEGPFLVEATWRRWQRFVLTTARVEARGRIAR